MRHLRGRQRGQAMVWAAVMAPLFMAAIGLAIDGGMLFDARRNLQNVADNAARAGAMQIDTVAVRATGEVKLDPAAAREISASYLASVPGVAGRVQADTGQLVVEVRREVPAGFIQLVGIRTVPVSAVATARACAGISAAAC